MKTKVMRKLHHLAITLDPDQPELRVRQLEAATAERGALYEFPISSETPVLTKKGWEILDHSEGAGDISRARGASVRDGHLGDVIGVVEGAFFRERRCFIQVRFSQNERNQRARIIEEETAAFIRRNWSPGFVPLLEVREGKHPVDGRAITRVTHWVFIHAAVVEDAADGTIGIGRGLEGDAEYECEVDDGIDGDPVKEEEGTMKKVRNDQGTIIEVADDDPRPAVTESPAQGSVQGREMNGGGAGGGTVTTAVLEQRLKERGSAVGEIYGIAQRNNLLDDVQGWLDRGLSVAEVCYEIESKRRTQGTPQKSAETLRLSQREAVQHRKHYSVSRALITQLNHRHYGGKFEGYEVELHQEMAKTNPPGSGGILLPLRIEVEGVDPIGSGQEAYTRTRALATTSPTGGAELIGQTQMGLIEQLINQSVVMNGGNGAQIFTGLQGNLNWVRETALPSVYWMEENPPAAVTPSEPGWGGLTLMPKTLMGQFIIPRQLMVQASIDVESFVKRRLGDAHSLAIDRGALHGTGTDKQPLGIFNAAHVGVQTVAMGGVVPTRKKLIEMLVKLRKKNVFRSSIAWVTTPEMAGVLMDTQVVSGQAVFLWANGFDDGRILGYRAMDSNQIRGDLGAGADEHGLAVGSWSELVIGIWGNALETTVDPYTEAGKAQVKVTTFGMADSGPMRPDAFVIATGAKLTTP